jgi:polyphosphate kinase
MERNFFKRVEIAFPVLDAALRAAIREHLELYLADTADAWILQPDGTYTHASTDNTTPVSAQRTLLERYTGQSGREHT